MFNNFFSKIRPLAFSKDLLSKEVVDFGSSVILTSLVAASLLLGLRYLGMLEAMELSAFDTTLQLRPDEGTDERLLVVGVTDEDILRLKEASLSDRTVTQLLNELEKYQPRVIGLDIFRDIPIGTGQADLIKQLQQRRNLIATCKVSDSKYPGIAPPPRMPEDRVGFADLEVDPGGILRRSLFFLIPPPSATNSSPETSHICNDPKAIIYSLSLRVALRYLESEGIQEEFTSKGDLKLGATVFQPLEPNAGSYQNADVGGYQGLINYRSLSNAAKVVTLSEVLEGKLNPSLVKDRVVLIGYIAQSSKDDFYTPYSPQQRDHQKMPGVIIHAQIVSQILSSVLNNRPLFWYWSDWVEVIWIGGWSLVGGTLAWRLRHPLHFSLAGVVALGSLFGISFGLFTKGGWVPLVPPALGLMAAAGSVVLVDRFHKAGYTKAISKGVKAIFKIDIDQEKRAQQVAEITETDYFQQLQQQAEELRTQSATAQENHFEKVNDSENSVDDYFEQLQRQAEELKVQTDQPEDERKLSEEPQPENTLDDYFERLQQQAKDLSNVDEEDKC